MVNMDDMDDSLQYNTEYVNAYSKLSMERHL